MNIKLQEMIREHDVTSVVSAGLTIVATGVAAYGAIQKDAKAEAAGIILGLFFAAQSIFCSVVSANLCQNAELLEPDEPAGIRGKSSGIQPRV